MDIEYNNEFSTIDTEIKAYYLGYFYGDGYIGISTTRKDYKQYTCSIVSKDKEIMELFHYHFPFLYFGKNNEGYYYSRKSSKKFYEDLLSWGIHPRKSTENKDLLHIPNIDKCLIPHFIRGFYDADGGYYLYKGLLETFCCTTSLCFITEIQQWFATYNIKLNLSCRNQDRSNPIYWLRSKNSKTTKLFYNLIFKDATIFLNRKHDKFLAADIRSGDLIVSEHYKNKPSNKNQQYKLIRDYKNVVEKYKLIETIENPSLCCNYHTIKSGTSHKKNTIRPLNLCLRCGKRSIFLAGDLKREELTGNS